MEPVKVGLVGAGPWAGMCHAPMLSGGPETELVGVWARREAAASSLAGQYGAEAFTSYEAMLEVCDAVAFAVPPQVQAEMAAQAAQAGRAVLMEKPIAESVASARKLVEVIEDSGVVSMVVLSYRFTDGVRGFLASAGDFEARGGRVKFYTNALLGGPFATQWRLDRGSIMGIGPHALDLLEAALGPIVGLKASHGDREWSALTFHHESGALSQLSLCSHTSQVPTEFAIEIFSTESSLALDVTGAMGPLFSGVLHGRKLGEAEAFSTLRREFAECVRTKQHHPLDARHGLRLQTIIEAAETEMATAPRPIPA
ncbi:MAG: hypothetical protein JWM76_23 [Pseudonocardiales bacterium]|nr:hypothetical protein [Pseudonocardiales bacterium]